ncbi:MAG TPA: homoserine dehydrogenase [bacterium]|nr:homoserine dehydrogenase [bacterium]
MTTTKREIGIGLIGLGTVGAGVWKLLQDNHDVLEQRTGVSIRVRKVCVSDLKKKRAVDVPKDLLTANPDDVINNPGIAIVVELIGGLEPAGSIILKAFEKGKHVVTANKALLADRAAVLFQKGREKGLALGFEASVAGGIPILKAIREGFIANRIQEIYGIINGTSNYILTEMSDKGAAFADVLKQAQKEGYAEQDPTFDVKGVDAAQKLAILIALAHGVEPPKSGVFTEGIDGLTPLDIEFAKKLGYSIKLLAICKEREGRIQARVHPTMIPLGHPLADVKGVFNAIFLKGDAVGETMFLGRGAGMMPTASAVVSDIAQIAQMIASGIVVPVPAPLRRDADLQPIEDLVTDYYLRFSVVDKPGVLAQIAALLGEQGISIASVYQQERDEGSRVPIVVMTHEARERNIRLAISKIDKLDAVLDKTVLIRVEHLK